MTAITFGTFDLTHVGHFRFFRRMKRLADRIIVMVQDSSTVAATKASGLPPVLTTAERLATVRACRWVDEAHPYRWLGVRLLAHRKFDVLCLGQEHPHDRRFRRLMSWCKAHGKRVVVFPRTKGISTTELRKRVVEIFSFSA